MKGFFIRFVPTFALTLVVFVIVSFLYGLIVHGAGRIDWGRAFAIAIVLGIVLSWTRSRDRKVNDRG
jgi:hypothetical protein